MKFTSYLFCLSLATAAGVLPVEAGFVYLPDNWVGNSCFLTIQFRANIIGPTITLRPTDGTKLIAANVRLLKDEYGTSYEAEGDTRVFPGGCYFERCEPGKLISMTCYSEYREIIHFLPLGVKKRSIHK